MAAHDRCALAQALPGGLLRVVEQQVQRLPVAIGRDDARYDQQQAPQKHEQPLQDRQPQHAEEEAEPVKEVADLGRFIPADVQREDHKADADHIVHDLQRDDEHDRNTGHTVMLKEADVCLLDRVGAELRGVCQRRGQAVAAHQVRRERRDEQPEGKDDQCREDRTRAVAGSAPAGVCFEGSTVQIHFDHNSVPGMAGSHFFIDIVYQIPPDLNTRSGKNSRFRHTLRFFLAVAENTLDNPHAKCYIKQALNDKAYARVVELADSLDSGSSVHSGRAGSSPASRTTPRELRLPGIFLPAANITAKKRRPPAGGRRRFFYAPKHVNMMTR